MSRSLHGMINTKTYRSWAAMIRRCTSDKSNRYQYYMAKGIKVCDEWRTFTNFLKDMGERPEGKSLDRIDNSKGYYKENCKWSTPKEQSLNRTSNILFTYDNRTMAAKEWAKEFNLPYEKVLNRIKRGLTGDAVFFRGNYRKKCK